MNIDKIKIIDSLFSHHVDDVKFINLKNFTWDRNLTDLNNLNNKCCVYTDLTLKHITKHNNKFKNNVAWLIESSKITKNSYDWIYNNNKLFTYVFTHNKKLLDKKENFIFTPLTDTWIKENDRDMHLKTKLVSIISSSKKETSGHKMRHELIKNYKPLDVYGRGYKPIENKITGLKNYMFSFAIENVKEDFYFTEKLLDCFVTGTIPIYYGCPSINNFFNEKGMIIINNINDIKNLNINESLYNDMLPYVKENYELAKKYTIFGIFLYDNLKKYKLI